MTGKAKLVLSLAGIFLAGAAIGSLVTLRVVREAGERRMAAEHFAPRQLARLVQELELTPEQQQSVRQILNRAGEEMRRLRRESMQATGARLREMNAEIAQLLTPAQNRRFEELQRQQRERMRRILQERAEERGRTIPRPPPGAPPPPPPGP